MSLFGNILSKLGIGKDKDKDKEADKPAAKPAAKPGGVSARRTPPARAGKPAAKAPEEMPMVDVVSKLEALAAEYPGGKLNWKVSIADLLSLLEIENSYEYRKELATELGCPAELMDDSAKMNTWLHKTVLQKIAENGGNVPKELFE